MSRVRAPSAPPLFSTQTPSDNRFLTQTPEISQIEVSQTHAKVLPQSVTQVLPSKGSFLSVGQSASILGVTRKTVLEWCESGKLPSISKPYGKKTTYQISPQSLEWFIQQQVQSTQVKSVSPTKATKGHGDYQAKWKHFLEKGLLGGRPFSHRTIEDYAHYIGLYFKLYRSVTLESFQRELMRISPVQFSKRDHYYKALVCYSKFLLQEGLMDNTFLEQVKALKPKRHLPPKRKVIDSEQLQRVTMACESLQDWLIILLLSQTGLRASEACQLEWEDIDLEKGYLVVRLGKGNKTRRVGVSGKLSDAFKGQESILKKVQGPILLDIKGKQMTRHGLYARLERIGAKAGVSVTPHTLRRAFVTLNANKGRPLQMLQMACGHSNIKTTMGYCLTKEQEVIDAMKDW